MPSYTGSALVASWVWSGGTALLNADYRTLTYTPTVDLVEDSAGADTAKGYVATLRSGQVAFNGVDQAGGMVTWGTALIEGQSGTLTIGPEGTAVGKRKIVVPAICQGAVVNWQYNSICELNVTWTQNGARTEGIY
jgi:hypothetical protein